MRRNFLSSLIFQKCLFVQTFSNINFTIFSMYPSNLCLKNWKNCTECNFAQQSNFQNSLNTDLDYVFPYRLQKELDGTDLKRKSSRFFPKTLFFLEILLYSREICILPNFTKFANHALAAPPWGRMVS